MTQREIAHKIEVFAHRLAEIMDETSRAANFEKWMLVKDIQNLAQLLVWTREGLKESR